MSTSVVAIYDTHEQAEQAVKELQQAGIDMKTLSIAGKDTHTDEQVVGYYNVGDRMKRWGGIGAFWGDSGDSCLGQRSSPFPDLDRFSWQGHWWPGLLAGSKAQLSSEA